MNKPNIIELTIRQYHQSLIKQEITCEELVTIYLERITTLDKKTKLNSMVVLNNKSLKQAQKLDEEYRNTGKLRPLHGVPAIIKDNFNTYDLQTAAGSLAMKGSIPPYDAYQVRKLRDAGAVLLGKSNMAEWAFSPYQTVSSIAGITKNPYDLERVPAGSSGGTAAAIAANFGLIGLGTDTGNSIRGPSSHCSLVGFRSTMGLTSRYGIVPLYLRNDIGGPICRTVEDSVRVLDIISGYDPEDPITKRSIGRIPKSYLKHLNQNGVKRKRIGVFRYYTEQPTTDPQIIALFNNAIKDLEKEGASIIDPLTISNFEELTKDLWCNTFKKDLNYYLTTLHNPPYKTLNEIYKSGLYSETIADRLKNMVESDPDPKCTDIYTEPKNIKLRQTILEEMDKNKIDAIIYPTWSNPPRKIGDLESPAGDNSQKIPPHTGLPGFTIPMGYTHKDLPVGLQIVGRLFSEPILIEIAYGYEQATKHRKPPTLFT
jgi:amidase